MKALLIAVLAAAAPALASERCPETPKDKWLRAEQIQARLQAQGYDVRRVKREGTCYEVKAKKEGKSVAAYVNPADGSVVSEKRS